MGFFEWKEEYSVGIKAMDAQHRRIIEMIDELWSAMRLGRGKEKVGDILENLRDYVNTHFKSEEKLMEEYEFPEYEEHKREHEEYAKKVEEFVDRYIKGEIGLSVHLLVFLKNWLSNHICITDKKYGPFLNKKGVK